MEGYMPDNDGIFMSPFDTASYEEVLSLSLSVSLFLSPFLFLSLPLLLSYSFFHSL